MVFTRSQAKKQQDQEEQQQRQQPQQRQQIHRKCKNTLPENRNISRTAFINNPIDFIDASIEWRKNKIKGENCTFEYIFL